MSLLAQLRNPVLPPSIGGAKGATEKTGGTALGSIIGGIVGMLFIAGFLLAFLTLLMGALNWITAGGDKTKLEAARNQITNALVGLAIVFAAWAIMKLIETVFGISVLDENLTPPKAY